MRNKLLPIALLCSMILLFTSTTGPVYEWAEYTPIFMDEADLLNSVSYHPGERAMNNPGKIYYKAPYIYVNEKYKGVHIINNSDPSHPVHEGFIVAPGCLDMAVKDKVMYIDNSVDLVAFSLDTKEVTKRIRNVFPTPPSPAGALYYNQLPGKILVGWKKQ